MELEKSSKSWGITLLLCVFFGFWGGHNFYAGNVGRGLGQFFTLGGLGVWSLIDLLTILTGNFKDNTGKSIALPAGLRPMHLFAGLACFVVLGTILAGLASHEEGGASNDKEAKTTSNITISKMNCDKVHSGMTKDQVKAILGAPTSTSETDMADLGKSDLWHYQDTSLSSFAKKTALQACDVNFDNGIVSMKNWTQL